MAFEPIQTKKFLNSTGVSHLWEKIRARYDSKLDSLAATNDSIVVTNGNSVAVQISAEEGNLLQLRTTGNKGLYVASGGDPDTYAVVRAADSGDYAAIYRFMKYINGQGDGVQIGVDINIPKDMVVQSGTVETKGSAGDWGPAGTYLHLVLANATQDDIYINVSNLIEYVTSGSQVGDTVMINIDSSHQVTATITDNTITADKLTPALRQQIAAGASAVHSVAEGETNGTISVDGTDVAVHGLNSAAYMPSTAFDTAGSAATVLGTNTDTAATMTVYGVKQYASDAYVAIQSLTNAEIDAAIDSVNT